MVQLVGILNVTPDSFSDGGDFLNVNDAVAQADKLFKDGASIVDVGAESTRPKAEAVSVDNEWNRQEPILKILIPKYPGQISLDSYNISTIKRAFEIGPVIINDVTGFNNPEMIKLAAGLNAKVIISHFPAGFTIQQAHIDTPVKDVEQVRAELLEKAEALEEMGLPHKNIILDPGIGFGKSPELNEQLLSFAEQVPEYKVMIGYSKKRFLGENRMEIETNIEAGRIAIKHGAIYLRVHDVASHMELLG
jgi:dihydropteroate synthase